MGCQGEVGVFVFYGGGWFNALRGGSNEQICIAAEIAMERLPLGMTCDPIGGLVQVPLY
ncbi:L-serine ammonia-lyase, iron-sulfur-dependent, subunit alpha [Vibrio lentus]|nr:L-serine ammonia-lyase, iron-sulfur-dependent, subunit alpha [Vibrio lentus]